MTQIPKHRDRIRTVLSDIRVSLLRDRTGSTEPVDPIDCERMPNNEMVVTDPDDREYVITVTAVQRRRRH